MYLRAEPRPVLSWTTDHLVDAIFIPINDAITSYRPTRLPVGCPKHSITFLLLLLFQLLWNYFFLAFSSAFSLSPPSVDTWWSAHLFLISPHQQQYKNPGFPSPHQVGLPMLVTSVGYSLVLNVIFCLLLCVISTRVGFGYLFTKKLVPLCLDCQFQTLNNVSTSGLQRQLQLLRPDSRITSCQHLLAPHSPKLSAKLFRNKFSFKPPALGPCLPLGSTNEALNSEWAYICH